MSRILWLGDGGCTTGYGRVTHAIGDRLAAKYGHEVFCLATNYDGDHWPTPMKMYVPNKFQQNDLYGQSRFVEMLAESLPEVTIMLNDPYIIMKFLLRNRWDEELRLARTAPILAYMPVDGTNQPITWRRIPEIVRRLPVIQNGATPSLHPVVMTEFGKTLFPDADVVFHGVDTEFFRKLTAANPAVTSPGQLVTNKREAKELLSIDPDSFLIVRVDRNSHRKNYGDTWRALVPVMKRHKDVQVWFHCRAEGDQLELPQMVSREPDLAERFHFPGSFSTKRGWSEDDMLAVYNAADLFVSTSWGEGFGLTLAEAAACEVPIVAQNVSSIPEVVGPGAILCEPERLTATDSGQDQWLPNVEAFTEAIEKLYSNRRLRRELGEAGRAHVVSKFNWDAAAEQFDRLIRKVVSGGTNGA